MNAVLKTNGLQHWETHKEGFLLDQEREETCLPLLTALITCSPEISWVPGPYVISLSDSCSPNSAHSRIGCNQSSQDLKPTNTNVKQEREISVAQLK